MSACKEVVLYTACPPILILKLRVSEANQPMWLGMALRILPAPIELILKVREGAKDGGKNDYYLHKSCLFVCSECHYY